MVLKHMQTGMVTVLQRDYAHVLEANVSLYQTHAVVTSNLEMFSGKEDSEHG